MRSCQTHIRLKIPFNYIVFEGNIGAGKTSFATRFASQYNGRLILERFHDNPFLPKFYDDPDKYSFPLELSFLAERYQQLNQKVSALELFSEFTVSDYLFFKCQIFASVNLGPDEFALYTSFFNVMHSNLPKPDLIVYLHQDIERLKSNIKHRGREYEQNITEQYLTKVESGYLNYFRQHSDLNVKIIDVSGLDFVKNDRDYEIILKKMF